MNYCQKRWPTKHEVIAELKPYWVVRNAFTIKQGLIMYNCCIVVPILQKETLKKLHQEHQGIERCRLSAQRHPGYSKQLLCLCQTSDTQQGAFHSISFTSTPLAEVSV